MQCILQLPKWKFHAFTSDLVQEQEGRVEPVPWYVVFSHCLLFSLGALDIIVAVDLKFQSFGSLFCLQINPCLVRPSNTRESRGNSIHRAISTHVIRRTRLSSGSHSYRIASTPRLTGCRRRSNPSCTMHSPGQRLLDARPACPISHSIAHCALPVCCSLSFGSHLG